MPTCTAPTPLTATVAQQTTASATTMSAALTALAGSSRALFDVQALPVEESEEVGLPMVIGTWGESVSFRSGGFFVWRTPDERWSMHTFCLDDEKLVTARIQQNGEQRELAVIWDPCVTSSMGHCQQVQLYRYDGPQWALRWQSRPGQEAWPYSHAEAQFAQAGIESIRIRSSSWAPRAEPWFPQDPRSQIFFEANAGPHRWFTDTWQLQGDHYRLTKRQVEPSAYHTLVEFIYALQSGGDPTIWVTDPQVIDTAQGLGLATLSTPALVCIESWPAGQTAGPIKIGECQDAMTVFFVQVGKQYLIERITAASQHP